MCRAGQCWVNCWTCGQTDWTSSLSQRDARSVGWPSPPSSPSTTGQWPLTSLSLSSVSRHTAVDWCHQSLVTLLLTCVVLNLSSYGCQPFFWSLVSLHTAVDFCCCCYQSLFTLLLTFLSSISCHTAVNFLGGHQSFIILLLTFLVISLSSYCCWLFVVVSLSSYCCWLVLSSVSHGAAVDLHLLTCFVDSLWLYRCCTAVELHLLTSFVVILSSPSFFYLCFLSFVAQTL